MGSNNPGGKGSGGFKSSKTRRARKYAAYMKKVNRSKSTRGQRWHKADSTT